MSFRGMTSSGAIFLLALMAFLLAGSFAPEAAMFPRAVSIIMMVAAGLSFLKEYRTQQPAADIDPIKLRRTVYAIALTIAYVALIGPFGFVSASMIFIPAMAATLGMRSVPTLALVSIMFVLVVFFLFERVFSTPLPRGWITMSLLGY